MKRQAWQLSLFIAAAAAAPAALAGPDIVKCVDPAGRVTLTDQPCAAGETASKVSEEPAPSTGPFAGAADTQAQPAVERYTLPRALPRRGKWQPPRIKQAPLQRDVATLKAAHLQLISRDVARHQQLAGLN